MRPDRIQAGGRALHQSADDEFLTAPRPRFQNRVDPFGEILFAPERGRFFGNRGGRFHREDGALGPARWTSRRWIACLCAFKGRRKQVFGSGYTDLFFLDEPTALAAGHRPCFECRRERATAFVRAIDPTGALRAPALDAQLDRERRDGRNKRMHPLPVDDLPDGAMFAEGGWAFAIRGDAVLPWSFAGYGTPIERPRGSRVAALTPPTSLLALANGYHPEWAGLEEAPQLHP